MKTLNGAPQFEENNFWQPGSKAGMTVKESCNEQLREWAESRRCVKCKFLRLKSPDSVEPYSENWWAADYCTFLENILANETEPETFSCAAFEVKT